MTKKQETQNKKNNIYLEKLEEFFLLYKKPYTVIG